VNGSEMGVWLGDCKPDVQDIERIQCLGGPEI
jgi:hypothetical protein